MSSSGVMRKDDAKDPTLLSRRSHSRVANRCKEQGLRVDRKSYRIGVPRQYNIAELEPAVRQTWLRTLHRLQSIGHSIHSVSLPTTEVALSAYYVIAAAEASSNLAKYDGVRYGNRSPQLNGPSHVLYATTRGASLGKEVKRRILLGSYSLSAGAIDNYFIQAQKVRRLVQDDFNKVFRLGHPLLPNKNTRSNSNAGVDFLVTPTSQSLPPTLDSIASKSSVDTFADDVLTVPASLAGLPALSIPVPIDPISSPYNTKPTTVGIQIIGQYGRDYGVLEFGRLLGLAMSGPHNEAETASSSASELWVSKEDDSHSSARTH